jgi:hypothetical protein
MGVATLGVQEALHFRCYITARKTRNMIHGWSKRSSGCSQDDDGPCQIQNSLENKHVPKDTVDLCTWCRSCGGGIMDQACDEGLI